MSSYYIDQGTQIKLKLNEGFEILESELKSKILQIKDELIKTNNTSANSHILKCDEMSNNITDNIQIKIVEESDAVEKNAQKWQEWFDNLKAIEGNNGYDYAKSNGFYNEVETQEVAVSSAPSNVIGTPADQFGAGMHNMQDQEITIDALKRLFNGEKKESKPQTRTQYTYYWTSYSSVSIDSSGYISININYYKKVDNGAATSSGGFTATITNDADYATYYTNRSSVGKG